ncbi:MAG: hypothetical protein KKC30_15655 [Proteobacteria bacterium]|nr:hypothetical protein [Pseudomonadota bacterium]MBU4381568.1 hypothetical protein [Pseudomonadota bacterium]MCG2766554.1 hypothetical protein [Desulfarculaceae bacterium]
MSDKVTVINVLPVAQTVAGYGQAAPGEELQVDGRVAIHLLKSEAWEEPKPQKKTAGRAAGQKTLAKTPADDKGAERKVTDGAD